MALHQKAAFRSTLVDIGKELTHEEVKELIFEITDERGECDKVNSGQDFVQAVAARGFVSLDKVDQFLGLLKRRNLMIAYEKLLDYKTKFISHHISQESNLPDRSDKNAANHEILVAALRRVYLRHVEGLKPIPFKDSRWRCVNDVYVEGKIEVLDRNKHENDPHRWTTVDCRHDVFRRLKTPADKRILIEGDPGYGKSTLLLQYAYDWCTGLNESPVRDFRIFVLLSLKELQRVNSIYEAIKLLLPENVPLSPQDIRDVIESDVKSVLFGFDGYDEYPDKESTASDVIKVIHNRLLDLCTAVFSTRPECLPKLSSPTFKHFRLSGFDKNMQMAYIDKALDLEGWIKDRIMQQLQVNPEMNAICQVPLFFVVYAHLCDDKNVYKNLRSVTGFFSYMMTTFLSHQENKSLYDNIRLSKTLQHPLQLEELAFDGLCSKKPKLVWEESDLVNIDTSTLEMFVTSGILIKTHVRTIPLTPGANEYFGARRKIFFKFFHKTFQEYYAALFISNRSGETEDRFKLHEVNPNDHQYVFRFVCGLNPVAAKVVLDHLTTLGEDGRMFATLCIMETGKEDIDKTVRELCSEVITSTDEDSKLLQRSTIQLLQIASLHQIPISSLKLSSCIDSVDLNDNSIRLTSGFTIPKLDTLEELTVYDTDCTQIVADLLNLSPRLPSLKFLRFELCDLPIQVAHSRALSSHQCKVSWGYYKDRLKYDLDVSTFQWKKDNGLPITFADYNVMPKSMDEVLKRLIGRINDIGLPLIKFTDNNVMPKPVDEVRQGIMKLRGRVKVYVPPTINNVIPNPLKPVDEEVMKIRKAWGRIRQRDPEVPGPSSRPSTSHIDDITQRQQTSTINQTLDSENLKQDIQRQRLKEHLRLWEEEDEALKRLRGRMDEMDGIAEPKDGIAEPKEPGEILKDEALKRIEEAMAEAEVDSDEEGSE